VDAELGFPNMPPPTASGTVVSPESCAADLKASRVSGPLLLRVGYTVRTQKHACSLSVSYSRRIDDPDHTSLAMSNLATVIPDRVGIVNSQCEDLGLWK
jgi:hypothetical protein